MQDKAAVVYTGNTPPPRPNPVKLFLASSYPGRRWPGALRAAVAMFIPGLIAYLVGHEDIMLLIIAGSCAVIYGEGYAYRARSKVIASAGAILIFGGFLSTCVGNFSHSLQSNFPEWWPAMIIAVYLTVMATVLVYSTAALQLPPPGAFFFVMVCGALTITARGTHNPSKIAGIVACGAAVAWLVGMSGVLFDRMQPERDAVAGARRAVVEFEEDIHNSQKRHRASVALQAAWRTLHDARAVRGGKILETNRAALGKEAMRLRHRMYAAVATSIDNDPRIENIVETDSARPHTNMAPLAQPTWFYRMFRSVGITSHAGLTATRVGVAGFLAALACIAFHFERIDWAIVAVTLTLQRGPDQVAGTVRGLHRIIGTAGGVLIYAAVWSANPSPFVLLLVVSICQFLAEVLNVRNYALCNLATTPLALFMGATTKPNVEAVMVDRFAETAIAAICSLAVLWLLLPKATQVIMGKTDDNVSWAIEQLKQAHQTEDTENILEKRRDLQFELHSNQYAAELAAKDWPKWTSEHWPQHLERQHAGYEILAQL